MTRDRIDVEVPASDGRRDRVEHQVFHRLDAIRAGERAEAALPIARTGARRAPWIALGAIAAAAAILVLLRRDASETAPSTPSRVVTPVGGASQFIIGDAVIDAGSDTSVDVRTDSSGITLTLARGTVDCDVEHRAGRPPFRVVAGEVTVEVVGTRFAVERLSTRVRVDVTRGKVRVRSPSGERFVAAGETWTQAPLAAIEPTAPPFPSPAAEPRSGSVDEPTTAVAPPAAPAPPLQGPSPQAAFDSAKRLAARDPDAAARGLRKVAEGSSTWAALALFDLAELEVARNRSRAALANLDEYRRRFPRGANAEDAAWLRVEVLVSSRQTEAARAAASDYLARFPSGTYARPAERLTGASR